MKKEIEVALKNLDLAVSMVRLDRNEHSQLINDLNNIGKYITELENDSKEICTKSECFEEPIINSNK